MPDVLIKDIKSGKMVKETVPLYFTPSDEGELYCSKEQLHAGPYKPTDGNALDGKEQNALRGSLHDLHRAFCTQHPLTYSDNSRFRRF